MRSSGAGQEPPHRGVHWHLQRRRQRPLGDGVDAPNTGEIPLQEQRYIADGETGGHLLPGQSSTSYTLSLHTYTKLSTLVNC